MLSWLVWMLWLCYFFSPLYVLKSCGRLGKQPLGNAWIVEQSYKLNICGCRFFSWLCHYLPHFKAYFSILKMREFKYTTSLILPIFKILRHYNPASVNYAARLGKHLIRLFYILSFVWPFFSEASELVSHEKKVQKQSNGIQTFCNFPVLYIEKMSVVKPVAI